VKTEQKGYDKKSTHVSLSIVTEREEEEMEANKNSTSFWRYQLQGCTVVLLVVVVWLKINYKFP